MCQPMTPALLPVGERRLRHVAVSWAARACRCMPIFVCVVLIPKHKDAWRIKFAVEVLMKCALSIKTRLSALFGDYQATTPRVMTRASAGAGAGRKTYGDWRRSCALKDRRSRSHRSQQRYRRYAGRAGGIDRAYLGAEKEWRLSLSAKPDTVAGNPARHARSTRRRHGARAGGEISARRAEVRPAGQSLTRRVCDE